MVPDSKLTMSDTIELLGTIVELRLESVHSDIIDRLALET